MKLKYKVFKIYKILFYFVVLSLTIFLKIFPQFRNIWIISERGYDARDNGYHLFKYINNLNNSTRIYYIIDKKSEDYKEIIDYNNVIDMGSLKHWIYFCLSKVKVSTHIMGYSPDSAIFTWLDKYNLIFGKKVFLQHGIISNNLTGLYYPSVNLDLFICGAKTEYEYVKSNFKHPINVVRYLGLSRYDNLIDSNKEKVILVMPTWRNWLHNCENDIDFMKTEYFNRYNDLINSEKMIQLLEDKDYRLIFYPHYEVQKYIHCFRKANNRVIIASKNEYDVQNLLKASSILITDYSSVYFDFAYMKKPIIFYTFDKESFFKNHYKLGYLSINKNPFGYTNNTSLELIETLNEVFTQNLTISKEIDNYIDSFFTFRDANNCKRNYEAIMSLLKK